MAATDEDRLVGAVRAWQDINLSALQPSLDAQGLEIVENQKESVQSRKRLAEQTKEFKKVPDEEKLKEFKNLLKAYQTEIDTITRRSKTAETAFLSLYKLLAEAPDPSTLFQTVIEQTKQVQNISTLEESNRNLKDELEKTKEELKEARKEEGVVVTLKTRLGRYEAMLEEMVAQKVAAKEAEMKQAMDEKIRIYKETEYTLQRQLTQLKDQMTSLQTTHEVTQARLVDHTQKYDDEVAAKLGELEILEVDLERANGRIAVLERDNEILKRELEKFRGEGEWVDPHILTKKLTTVEHELALRRRETEDLQTQLHNLQSQYSQRVGELERDLKVRNLEVKELEARLSEREDYEVLKEELEVFKSIEFDGLETQDSTSQPLEQLLLQKTKKLGSQLTETKLSLSESQSQLSSLYEKLEEVQRENESLRELVGRLEDDLAKMESGGRSASTPGKVGLEGLIGVSTPTTTTPLEPQSSSIVPILTSQRDRYRTRCSELEQQIRDTQSLVSDLRSECDRLKSDNNKLYERIRYAQSFDSTSSLHARNSPSQTTIPIPNEYTQTYESRLDPFTQFHQAEKQRRINNLNPADKSIYFFVRLILGHRWLRWGFVGYCVVLHGLVWWVLGVGVGWGEGVGEKRGVGVVSRPGT